MEDDIFSDKPKYTAQQASTLKEMARQAQDRIRVYNPTDEDFIIAWDLAGSGGRWVIPNKNRDAGYGPGQQVLLRYVAKNYVIQMINKILGSRRVKAIMDENDKRASMGKEELDKHTSQGAIETKYREDNETERDKVRRLLWLGIEEEFGMDISVPEDRPVRKYSEDALIDQLDRPARKLSESELPALPEEEKRVDVNPPAPTVVTEAPVTTGLEEAKNNLAQEVAA